MRNEEYSGIDSISLNPDSFIAVKHRLAESNLNDGSRLIERRSGLEKQKKDVSGDKSFLLSLVPAVLGAFLPGIRFYSAQNNKE
jgi:hypothetical protein